MLIDGQEAQREFPQERARIIRVLVREFRGKIDVPDIKNAVDKAYAKWYEPEESGTGPITESRDGFVFRCARNHLFKFLRRKAHEAPMSEVTWELDALDSAEANREAKGDVKYLFSKLPKPWRRVIKLSWIDGFEIAEIAELMHRTKGAIYHIKEKAEKRFKELGIKDLAPPPPPPPPSKNHAKQNKNKTKKS